MTIPHYCLSASLVCANFLNLKADIEALERARIDELHVDVMDGIFVPRYGLFPEFMKAIHSITSLPFDVHMMVEDSRPYIPTFLEAGATILMVHVEKDAHLHRTLKLIRDAGGKAGVVLNPATSLHVLDHILDDIDRILLMAINPGIVGHPFIPMTFDKIAALKQKIGRRSISIEIDGGVSFDTAGEMVSRGADVLVCGSSTIFKSEIPIEKKVQELRTTIDAHFNSSSK